MSKCLIIIGMHRSGTSFTASLLQNAGLHIGEKLLKKNTGNLKGHFENEDFYNFHIKVLEQNFLDQNGWDLKTIPFQEKFKEEAQALIAKNTSALWGWKDPRTILFLDFWKHLLPDANFLFIYRSPWEVVDSIYRRGDELFSQAPEKAADVWAFYNQTALDFYINNKERSALYHLEDIIHQPKAILTELNERFGLNLQPQNEKIFDEEIFNQKNINSDFQQAIVHQYSPRSIKIYEQLQQLAGKKSDMTASLNKEMMYRYWFEFNQTMSEINKLTKIILWMKKSRFWKLRTIWLKIKNLSFT